MKLDDRATQARSELDELFAPAPIPPAAGVRTVSRRRRTLQAGAGVLAIAALALGVTAVIADDQTNEPIILTPPDGTATTVLDVQLETRLELDATTVEVGGRVTGHLVIENATGAPIVVNECVTLFKVELTSGPQPKGAYLCNSSDTASLSSGSNRFAFDVAAPTTVGTYATYLVRLDNTLAPSEPVVVTVVERTAESTATTSTARQTTTTVPLAFPAARTDLVQGGQTWAVVLGGATVEAGTPSTSNPTIAAAVAAAQRAGYDTGPTDCDQGAAQALGADPNGSGFTTVSVYFSSEADARLAADLFRRNGHQPAVVAQLATFCLD